jgi:uncharacterized membrane protein
MNRALTIALAVSLTLNVFIVGAAVGVYVARPQFRPDGRPPGPGGNPMMNAAERLPPDVAVAYRTRMRVEGATAQPLLQEARQARREAAEAFAQPTFDKAAATAALARARTAETAAREKLETAVVDFAAALPADQRRVLGAGIRQPPRGPGGGGRRGGRGGPGGPPPFEGRMPGGDGDRPRDEVRIDNAP